MRVCEGRDTERKKGEVPWWNHLQPQASLVRDCRKKCVCVRERQKERAEDAYVCVIKMNTAGVCLSI